MTTLPLRSASAARGPNISGPLLSGPLPVWVALFGSVLTFLRLQTLVPIPRPVGQMITQGMLALALVLVLLANPRAAVRLNPFLIVVSLFAVIALMVSVHNDFVVGSTYRAVRLVIFVVVLWLLTPWWGRPDLPLLRAHVLCLRALLLSVLAGVIVAPGAAFSYEGRLSGALWPIPPTQVAHYAAMLLGLTVVLWFCGLVRGRTSLITAAGTIAALTGTHTRTALAALMLGLIVAGASLYVGHVRVRRTAGIAAALGLVAATFFAPVIVSWASRGQSLQEASQLTGRTKVWSDVFALQRTWVTEWFGSGLADKSYGGRAIDSSWVATYLELGWAGVGLSAAFLVVLILTAVARPAGPRRAVALFIITYCLMASFTETGLGDASPYLLELTVAASLLATPAAGLSQTESRSIGAPFTRSPPRRV